GLPCLDRVAHEIVVKKSSCSRDLSLSPLSPQLVTGFPNLSNGKEPVRKRLVRIPWDARQKIAKAIDGQPPVCRHEHHDGCTQELVSRFPKEALLLVAAVWALLTA